MLVFLKESKYILALILASAVAFALWVMPRPVGSFAEEKEIILSSTDDENEWAFDAFGSVSLTLGHPDGKSGVSLLLKTDERNDSGFVYLGSRSGFSPAADASSFDADRISFDFWLYVNNVELARKSYVRFELTSAGGKANPADNEEKQQVLFNNGSDVAGGIKDGWNHIVCNLSGSRISFDRINYFRFFIAGLPRNSGVVTFALHDLKIIESDLKKGETAVTENQTVDEPYFPMVVRPIDKDNPPEDKSVIFASGESSGKWADNVVGAYNGKEEWIDGCVLAAGSGGMVVACRSDGAGLSEANINRDYAYVTFWIYSEDFSAFTKTGQFELNSSAGGSFDDDNEMKWDWTEEFVSSFEDGKWNKVELKLPVSAGSHLTGNVDTNALKYFRMWNFPSSGSYGFEALMLVSDILITEKDYNPADWDESLMRISAVREASFDGIDKTNVKFEVFDTPYNAVNSGAGKNSRTEPEVVKKEEVKAPSDVWNVTMISLGAALCLFGAVSVCINIRRVKIKK